MKTLADQLTTIRETLERIEPDLPKIEQGNAKAGRRVRKEFQTIVKAAKAGRTVILEQRKED